MADPRVAEALESFCAIVDGGGQLTAADLPMVDALLGAMPWFTLPAAKMLQCEELSASDRARLSAAVALNAPDSASLMKLIDPDGKRFASFYPPEPVTETPTTERAIDTFLDQYGTVDPHEQALLERLIFNPVPDYSQVLAQESGDVPAAPLSEQDAMLDAFLATQDASARRAEEVVETAESQEVSSTPVVPDADSSLSESLAKIYIKQHRYDKAYEIISQLSLNFPKKSIYFADQLRFLKKLIYISQKNADKQ